MALFPSLDVKAIAYGCFVTFVLSCTMVVAGLKAGITPGVSPLVVLCGWGAFTSSARGGGGSRFLNLAQVAGSSGMAIVSGVIFSEPLLQVLHLNNAQSTLQDLGITDDLANMPWEEAQKLMKANGIAIPEVNIPVNILACLAGSFIGWGFVGLSTKKFLSDPTLPAPEAKACMSMITAAVSEANTRPKLSVSLVLSIFTSFFLRILVLISLAVSEVVVWSTSMGKRAFAFTIPLDSGPLYIGIGGLLTLPIAILTFAGAFMRLIGDFMLSHIEPGSAEAEQFPANSMRWVGGGAMTVGVLYSLVKFMPSCRRRPQREGEPQVQISEDEALLAIGPGTKNVLAFGVAVGMLTIGVWLFAHDGFSAFSVSMLAGVLLMAALMVPLGAILSLQIGGSSSPVSGTVFVTTLVLCGLANATHHTSMASVPTITILLVAACVAVCAANDVSQDYKTLQLCRVPPRDGFVAQILGLLVGSLVVPVSLYISANAFGLGTSKLPAPQGQMFATLVDGLLIQSELPWYPIIVGLMTGVAAVGMDILGSRAGQQLPAMAFAVGIYLSPDTGVGILIGALFRHLGEVRRAKELGVEQEQTHECILASAGMITGAASLDLILGIMVLFNFDIEKFSVFTNSGEAGKAEVPSAISNILAVLGVLFLGWILYRNSRMGTGESGASNVRGNDMDTKDKAQTKGDVDNELESCSQRSI